MSEQRLSTRPKTCMHHHKFKISSLCRPKTHFKDTHSPQWASTIIGFSIFIQKRTFALSRVEHQKSVNIANKFEKSIVDFQKSSKTFSITTYKEKSKRRTIQGSKFMLHWWSSSIGKKKSDNWKVQANSKNTPEHTSNFSSRRLDVHGGETNWSLLADFSPCRYGDKETKQNWTEDVQVLSIRGQFTFGAKLQTFQ